VYNRGGTGDFGMIKIGMLFTGIIALLAKNGYAIIATQYSGVAGGEGKDEMGGSEILDVLNLHKIIQKISFIDTSRIGMYGGSRGGMMTYLALTHTKWLKAAVTVSALSDLLVNEKFRPEMIEHYKRVFGGSIKEKKKRSATYWPEHFPKKVPLLIMCGTADWRVSPQESMHLVEKLYEQKVPVRFISFEGADNGLSEHKDEASEQTLKWFNRFVKEKHPLPNLRLHGK
jgi:dipeptidyl aminopeptidase/acylaminoacyl peptidase